MKRIIIPSTLMGILFIFGSICLPQSKDNSNQFGVGVQVSTPIIGLSAIYKVTPAIGVQGILGFISTMKFYGVRGNYYFDSGSQYKPYVFAMLGSASYKILDESESIFTYGIGGGAEYISNNWGLSADIGYGSFKFDKINISVSSVIVGAGIHYYVF